MASHEEKLIMTLLYIAIPLFPLLFFLSKWLRTNPSKSNTPPSPPRLPIIGNLHQMGFLPHRALGTLSHKYGEVMSLRLGSNQAIVISSAKMASKVFKTFDSVCAGRPNLKLGASLFYNNKDMVLAPYGKHWRQMRSISTLHLFTKKRVESFRVAREEALALMIESIKESSSRVNMSEMFVAYANDVISMTALGKMYRGEEGSSGVEKLIDDIAGLFGDPNLEDVIPWMSWINKLNGFNAKVSRISRVFDEFLERVVQEHEDKEAIRDDGFKDLVDVMLEVQRNGDSKGVSIDKETIKSVMLDMFAAGTHTGSITLVWVFTEMLRQPRILKRLQEEIRAVIGDKMHVSEEDIERMTYLKAVLKENFRMHPPLPLLLPRVCIEDITLNDYHIASGTQILTNAWAIGMDPENWEDPESFNPERFLDSTVDFKGQDFELIPFGAGRRGCPGISFAMASIELAVVNLVHQFEWMPPVGEEREALDVTEAPGLAANKKHPLVLVATMRNE